MQKKMIKVTNKNRDVIIDSYVSRLLDDMDFDALYSFAYSMVIDSKKNLSNTVLEDEIVDYCPDILEE